jgi:hypothetical protein
MKVSKFAWVLGISSGFSALLLAPAARAADYCKVYPDANIPQGTGGVVYLPADVTATAASGGANNSSWANSSSRVLGTRLTQTGLNNKVSSIEVNAADSDVSLYLMDGETFDGAGYVMYCKKGFSCWINLPSSINNKNAARNNPCPNRRRSGNAAVEATNPTASTTRFQTT